MPETPQQYIQRILGHSRGKDALSLQRAAPGKFAALITGLSAKHLKRRPDPQRWSIAEILAHMADVELVMGYRMRLILASNKTPIQAFDQDAWAETFNYKASDAKTSLETFRILRENNLRLLSSVPRRLWKNYGQHQERGKERMDHIVRLMAGHDLNHLQQVKRIVKQK